MFESIREAIRSFSFSTILKGNILSTPGSFGGTSAAGLNGSKSNSPAAAMTSNRYLSTYYNKMQEIQDYEISELTDTILQIYIDYLTAYFNKSGDLVTLSDEVPNKEKRQLRLNQLYEYLKIVEEIKGHLREIIYNGSWCFKIAFDKETRNYRKFYLQNPHNVITIMADGKQKCHLVVSRDGKIYQVLSDSIFRLGKAKMSLINDVNRDFFGIKKEDTLVNDEFMMAAMPLYYNITGKVKEFILKEQILSLLSIKDLVQPLLLLVRLDKNTDPGEGNKLALNIENMINKYSDISSILSSNFSINSLIDSLMNNIRVIPDYHSTMGDMNNVDLSKVTNKINEIETNQENKKESVLTACSIPKSLYNGESTKWDAIKSNQRLNSKVNSLAVDLTDGLVEETCKLYEDLYGEPLDKKFVKINLFTKTEVDFNTSITNTEIIGTLLEGIQRILLGCQQTIQDIKFIDPEEYSKFVMEQLKLINPDADKFITEETIKNYINQAKSEPQQ